MVSHIEPHHQNDQGITRGRTEAEEQFAGFVPPLIWSLGRGDWGGSTRII